MQKKDVQIRLATPTDAEIINTLSEQIWYPTYESILGFAQTDYMFQLLYNKAELARLITENEQLFFICSDGTTDIGFAAISSLQFGTFKLNKIYILPQKQSSGLGRAFLKHIETEIVAREGSTVLLNVNRYNNAQHFYEKLGYTVIREEDIPIGPYFMNDYVMSKSLVSA